MARQGYPVTAIAEHAEITLDDLKTRHAAGAFEIGEAGGEFHAVPLFGGKPLSAPTPGELAAAILDRAEHSVNGVQRLRDPAGADEAECRPRGGITLESILSQFWFYYHIEDTEGAYVARRAFDFGRRPLKPVKTLEELDSLLRADYAKNFQ